MGRKRKRYENTGNIQTVFTVNFRDPDQIDEIFKTFAQNEVMCGNMAKLFCNMQCHLLDYDFSAQQAKSILEFAVDKNLDNNLDTSEDLIAAASKVIECAIPGQTETNQSLIRSFSVFFFSLPSVEQCSMYESFGKELNTALYEQTKSKIDIQNMDIEKLLNSSSSDLFKNADERLQSFVSAAVKTDERRANEEKESKRMVFCSNIIENLLKARNLKYVSPSGLSVLTLVYILSGRSKQACQLFSTTGAKGSYRLVKEYVLPNSKETSYKHCQDGVTVYYTFDNAQKLFKTWRLHGNSNDKSLAMVTTSIVHCYPDGLISSDVQYTLRHSPMVWLHSFEVNKNTQYLVEKLDIDVLRSMIKLDEGDEDLVLGRFDYDVESAIKQVQKETNSDGKDIIDLILNIEENEIEALDKFCEDGHRNIKPRGNQIKCKVCKKQIFKRLETNEEFEVLKDTVKQIIVRNDASNGKMHDIVITDADEKVSKAKLYPRVRNNFNENQPMYRSQGTILANPNTFARVKLVLRGIKKLTGTSEVHNSSITFTDEKSISEKAWGVHNLRTWIAITVDGLPHKLLIEVIKHSFICEECGKDFDVMSDVTDHFKKHGHKTFFKEFGNCILKIGGLHAEMNMLRSFVSLTWKIYYSYLCKAIGFVTPKAQLVQSKVTDMHKGWDTFIAQRNAMMREFAKLFLDYATEHGIEASSENFEEWEKTVVKNKKLKMLIQIQKYFGTSLWMYRAGTRSNHLKLSRAGIRIFSGLFHINGNHNYSIIELYDEYVMSSMEQKNPELFQHFSTRLVTNLKNEEYCSQSHDARHEEANKQAQNMLSGKDLEEFDLAFRIVDDLEALKVKYYEELGVADRTKETSVVVPDYEVKIREMRTAIRRSQFLDQPYDDGDLDSAEGEQLNGALLDVFKISRQSRDSDILNVIRFSDFSEGYNSKSRIPILESDKVKSITTKEVEDQIYILLHCIKDPEEKELLTEIFVNEKVGKDDLFFKNFLTSLIDQSYSSLIL